MSKNDPISPSNFLLDTSREYAIYVCSYRAIPAVQDGLKQGQRIALWLLRNRAEKVKTFALSGLMGYERLYVHGETSANNAIGLLAAPFKNNVPLIEGLGQFGSRVAPVEGIGAPRYTDVRRAKAAEALLYADLDLVPLEDNYDGSNVQPLHFLPLIPTVLLNGVSGVAVGWSTEILPRSLKALIEATRDALMGRKPKTLVPFYNRYEIGVKPLEASHQWEYTGRVSILDTSSLRISELPPNLNIETFRKRLIAMEESDAITSFTDRSTEVIDITVRMKRGSLKDWTEQTAIDFFKLRERATERINVVDWNGHSIRSYATAEELVVDFAAWRLGWYTKRFEALLAADTYEIAYWRALRVLLDNNFTRKLGSYENKAAVKASVASIIKAKGGKLVIDEAQVERVVNLPTYRWNIEFSAEVNATLTEISGRIDSHVATLASPDALRAVYLAELDGLKSLKV